LKIDIYTHILPVRYKEFLYKRTKGGFYLGDVNEATPTLWDLNARFNIMDRYEEYKQVITIASPPIEEVLGQNNTVELAKISNDEMAELINKYPDRFVAAVANLPMNSIDDAMKELERTIIKLGFKGVQIYTPINDKPIDLPEFDPLYEKMTEFDLPIWIHPLRNRNMSDYKTEDHSKYWIFSMFGWPYETTAAMTRIVFSGILEKYPRLKLITHHCGGMIPFFIERMTGGQDYAEICLGAKFKKKLNKTPAEYYQMFYGDTALYGHTPGLMCGYSFFGAEHLLFGSDMPYDCEGGNRYIRTTIEAIDKMDISGEDKKLIYEGNAKRLLHL